ncbi:MAG: hypothetical protein F6K26_01490 [Moorea sp. SIO2I5]|nr:hypothetical protein [Moorena sp. SIO2I5]
MHSFLNSATPDSERQREPWPFGHASRTTFNNLQPSKTFNLQKPSTFKNLQPSKTFNLQKPSTFKNLQPSTIFNLQQSSTFNNLGEQSLQ